MTGAAGQQRVPEDFLKDFEVRLPPPSAQRAIADFLDRKTAAIDTLIEKKQRLLALLAERRTALIHHAVNTGLDPDVPMKDSGVPWIGEIPVHWEVVRLRFLADVRGGVTKSPRDPRLDLVSVPYLRVANVQDGYLDLREVKHIQVEPREAERYALLPGDVLMNEGGDFDKLGRGTVWEGQVAACIHQNHVFAVRPLGPELARWIATLTESAYLKFFFQRRSKRATNLASISNSNVKDAPILLPPSEERARILDLLREARLGIDSTLESAATQIERLREYRQALITAAVTGQIDIASAEVPDAP